MIASLKNLTNSTRRPMKSVRKKQQRKNKNLSQAYRQQTQGRKKP